MRVVSLLLMYVLLAPMWVMAQGTPDDDRISDAVRRKLAADVDVKDAGLAVVVKKADDTQRVRVDEQHARVTLPRIVHTQETVTR